MLEDETRPTFPPASTFKIANSLIGLDAGVVKAWTKCSPGGNRNVSKNGNAIWACGKRSRCRMFLIELARRIGIERMREGVKKLGYGNMEIGSVVDRFWLDGPLAISRSNKRSFLAVLADRSRSISTQCVR